MKGLFLCTLSNLLCFLQYSLIKYDISCMVPIEPGSAISCNWIDKRQKQRQPEYCCYILSILNRNLVAVCLDTLELKHIFFISSNSHVCCYYSKTIICGMWNYYLMHSFINSIMTYGFNHPIIRFQPRRLKCLPYQQASQCSSILKSLSSDV